MLVAFWRRGDVLDDVMYLIEGFADRYRFYEDEGCEGESGDARRGDGAATDGRNVVPEESGLCDKSRLLRFRLTQILSVCWTSPRVR